jgi:hypothetical protein
VRNLRTIAAAAAVLCLLYGVALADTLKFTVTFEPDKEGGPGKGTATLSVDTATKVLTYSIEYAGLTAPPTMVAFLSPPADPKGSPGTLQIKLPAKPASPLTGTMPLTDDQITGLKTGQWLLLLGSTKAPEIGGEVKPAS